LDIIPVKTPNSIKKLFPNYVWDFYSKKEKKIFLTFDDGPIPEITEFVLEQLHLFNAKATFFCIGQNIQKHPDVFLKIIKNGHQIGNHTMNHLKARKSTLETYMQDVIACQKRIDEFIQPESKLFRPPYGHLSTSKLREIRNQGYEIILWDILSKDWDKNVSPEQCYNNSMQHIENGSIVVFHDSIKASKNLKFALPRILKHFTEEGYIFASI